jgi:subtilisin family serine protease
MLDYRLNTLSAESSKGYTRSGLVKPDLLAPGVNVGGVAADGSIMVRTGTSVAAAHTAGAAALLLEYGIVQGNATYLDGNNVRTLLIRGAKRQEGVEYPNRDQGYGVLDVYGVFHG